MTPEEREYKHLTNTIPPLQLWMSAHVNNRRGLMAYMKAKYGDVSLKLAFEVTSPKRGLTDQLSYQVEFLGESIGSLKLYVAIGRISLSPQSFQYTRKLDVCATLHLDCMSSRAGTLLSTDEERSILLPVLAVMEPWMGHHHGLQQPSGSFVWDAVFFEKELVMEHQQ